MPERDANQQRDTWRYVVQEAKASGWADVSRHHLLRTAQDACLRGQRIMDEHGDTLYRGPDGKFFGDVRERA